MSDIDKALPEVPDFHRPEAPSVPRIAHRTRSEPMTDTYDIASEHAFAEAIRQVLAEKGAQEYGDTARPIYHVLGPAAVGYALVEKGLRYGKKGNIEDLVKAAAYAYLAWSGRIREEK